MKKFIAYLLLLTMCVSLFAGCAEKADEGLESAKTYLYNLYKDKSEVTADDYSVVGVVIIQGVGTYEVEWTVDTDVITVHPMGEDKMVLIELPDASDKEITYKLTATIKSESGESVSLSFDHKILAAAGFSDGTYVITTNGLSFSALSESSSYGYPYANEVTVENGTVTGHYRADVMTITNVEGGVTIQDIYGRYIYMKDSYNSFNVSTEAPEEGHIWKILEVDGGYQLVNIWNQKTLAYSSSYTSWGAYAELDDSHSSTLAITAATAPETDPESDVDLGIEADANITIAEALNACEIVGNRETSDKYYITGTVTEITGDVYGNFYVQDETGTIYVYGCYDSTGTNRYDAMENAPQVGDTVTLYGVLMSYSGTAQMKNAWVTDIVPGSGETTEPTDPVDPTEPDDDKTPAADSTITIAQAIELGQGDGTGTTKYYITGKVTQITQTTYGNFYIEDSTGTILVYGCYDATGTNRYDAMDKYPQVGDTVTLYGVLNNYNGESQMKNAWCISGGTGSNASTGNDTTSGGATVDVTLTNGMKVVIYAPAYGKALSSLPSSEGSYYQKGVDVALNGDTLTGYSDTEVWTVVANSDGTYSFAQDGKNLGMQDQYSSMSLGAVNDDWKVISLGDGLYLIQNVVRNNCIEWYAEKGNWSSYTTTADSGNDLFHLAFYVVAE